MNIASKLFINVITQVILAFVTLSSVNCCLLKLANALFCSTIVEFRSALYTFTTESLSFRTV